jgi:hypothetical protein
MPPGEPFREAEFDPFVSLFDSTCQLVGLNEDGTGFVDPDPNTGAALDSYLSEAALTLGTYTVVLTQSDNLPNGPTPADGFHEKNAANFTSIFLCSNGEFCDITFVDQ